TSLRERFRASLAADLSAGVGVSLSGGIDSGGILAILTDLAKHPIPSVSFGAHGKGSDDLTSSRQTAAEFASPNTEIYPSRAGVARIPEFVRKSNLPFIADNVLPYGLLMEEAHRRGMSALSYGLGAEMLLGNLKIAHMAYSMRRIEAIVPRPVLRAVYLLIAQFKHYSENQRAFLFARSWTERFVLARAPLFNRERDFYKNIPRDFLPFFAREIDATLAGSGLDLSDEFSLMYLFSWVCYVQRREMGALGKKFDVSVVMPFDTIEVAEQLFKTPNAFRRKNKWKKMVIRDLYRPYISDRLYNRKGKSLVVHYTPLLAPAKDALIAYLKTSPLVRDMVDMEKVAREYDILPEPGLFLLRFFGLAAWYDENWNKENLPNLETVCAALREA
ncbi:MAG TPA: asparagine synthase C-terminal domain-containing protein, partial [Candidatus Paceibacterota bacterium]|nr:asparagine synthase C-terminal domain-containing protein [Candidatus Paceibacterota bacterium]